MTEPQGLPKTSLGLTKISFSFLIAKVFKKRYFIIFSKTEWVIYFCKEIEKIQPKNKYIILTEYQLELKIKKF